MVGTHTTNKRIAPKRHSAAVLRTRNKTKCSLARPFVKAPTTPVLSTRKQTDESQTDFFKVKRRLTPENNAHASKSVMSDSYLTGIDNTSLQGKSKCSRTSNVKSFEGKTLQKRRINHHFVYRSAVVNQALGIALGHSKQARMTLDLTFCTKTDHI